MKSSTLFFTSAVVALIAMTRCGGRSTSDRPTGEDSGSPCSGGGCASSDASAEGGVLDAATSDALDGSLDALHDGAGDGPSDAASEPAACSPLDGSAGSCDPLAQCGCPNDMACGLAPAYNVELKPATICHPAGSAKPQSHCSSSDDCAAGYECAWAACRPICASDADCAGKAPYNTCLHIKYTDTLWEPPDMEGPYGVCLAECDPANPKYASGDFLACGKGFQCQPVPPNTLDVVPGQTMCMYWSDQPRLGAGQACTYDNDCDPGFACRPITLTPPDDGGIMVVCRRWCHVGDNSCGSSACEPTGLFAGDVELGLCLPW
ncbi:MAG: hypothetical protein KC776_09995 [Myxococcales bacterium]|nr:hypothetical protein [Myxococcales bacterium]MCB9582626.1 hypothetical protein [Polyangiaceae bacterium]